MIRERKGFSNTTCQKQLSSPTTCLVGNPQQQNNKIPIPVIIILLLLSSLQSLLSSSSSPFDIMMNDQSSKNVIKVLITGASGMLGRSIYKHFHQYTFLHTSKNKPYSYECIGTAYSRCQPPYIQLNLLNQDDIRSTIRQIKPNIIIHCAAERYPDKAESDPKRTMELNVQSTRVIAEECKKMNILMVYISTDYVFDGGIKSGVLPPYDIDSITRPINLYGQSKLDGEKAVFSVFERSNHNDYDNKGTAMIVRVPVLYATDCDDLSESATLVIAKMLLPSCNDDNNACNPKMIDHWGIRFPTLVDDVSCVLRLITTTMNNIDDNNNNNEVQILHISSPEQCTKYELAQCMANIIGMSDNMFKKMIQPDSKPPSGVPRPQNTQLNCSQTWKVLQMENEPYRFMPLKEGIKSALEPFMDQFDP